MILTLAWKEIREHQGVWLTMVFMTVFLGLGFGYLVGLGDKDGARDAAAFTILGMAATYGIVCGAMMLAGEHEGGTLVFLDVFSGRRGRLWFGKFFIGVVLAVTEGLVVATILRLLHHEPPHWAMTMVGQDGRQLDSRIWMLILPMITLEAYALGLLGSSLTQRVLAGAAVAAMGVMPLLVVACFIPPHVSLPIRIMAALALLALSYTVFLFQSRETTQGTRLEPETVRDVKDRFLDAWDEFEDEDEEIPDARPVVEAPPLPKAHVAAPPPEAPASPKHSQAASPYHALWWLTVSQAPPVVWPVVGSAFLLMGFVSPANSQGLWPFVTLLLGVLYGTAVFASEQQNLSYQFLAAQHFPLKTIWRFKILFWLTAAVLDALLFVSGNFLSLFFRRAGGFQGTLPVLMGPTLFFGVWLLYGFCSGQLIVWLCRKNILALLVSSLVAVGALGLWMPSLLCGGMGGWQLWPTPLMMLLATWFLMRAWAGGRIQERNPVIALIGFASVALVWALLNFAYRAWEIPDVGEPFDPMAFRAAVRAADNQAATRIILRAVDEHNDGDESWWDSITEASRMRLGVLELPRADEQAPQLRHLRPLKEMIDELDKEARNNPAGPAFEYHAQILTLSRTLRHKAPLESYLAGAEAEQIALDGLDKWLTRIKPDPQMLRRVLDELNRHAAETSPPMDCLQTECLRSSAVLLNPNIWTLQAPGAPGRMPEQWLAGAIATSLEAPWESERKTRIWQLTWAGLFRAMRTPHWELPPEPRIDPRTKDATRKILQGWLPAPEGPGQAATHEQMARWLDASWLADERLFCSTVRLREAATRGSCRVDATRLAVALGLCRLEERQSAQQLQDLVPKYFPAGLPTDPYSGQSFHYRLAGENELGRVARGQGIVWSTGPDRIDHGGHKDGSHLADDAADWPRGDFDLITLAPHWP